MRAAQGYQGHRAATRFAHGGFARWGGALAGAACLACVTLVTGCASQNSNSAPAGSGSTDPTTVTPSGTTYTVTDNANGKTVHVNVGTQVELLLASSYWMVHGSSAASVLRQDGGPTVMPRPTNCAAIPGLGCRPVRTEFTASAAGTATLTADRTTCGEAMACAPNQRHFIVTVVVQ